MRSNNFDIVRLSLAVVVVLFHAGILSASPALAPLRGWMSGELAVQGFFVISGFLIFASWERTPSLADYAVKRAARILPGYWLAAALCVAIALGYRQVHIAPFLLANLSFLNFLHPSIAGVFSENPQTTMVNGALWTIKIEVMFYFRGPDSCVVRWQGKSRRTALDDLRLVPRHTALHFTRIQVAG